MTAAKSNESSPRDRGACHSRQTRRPRSGAKIYDARTEGSRFLAVDPVEGGSCYDYDYVCGDPINYVDLEGTYKRNLISRRANGSKASINVITQKPKDKRAGHVRIQFEIKADGPLARGLFMSASVGICRSNGDCKHDSAPDLIKPWQTAAHTSIGARPGEVLTMWGCISFAFGGQTCWVGTVVVPEIDEAYGYRRSAN